MSANGYSGGWEKVGGGGKSGPSKSPAKPGSKGGAKAQRPPPPAPKWNDVLPLGEVSRFEAVLDGSNGGTKRASQPNSPAVKGRSGEGGRKKPAKTQNGAKDPPGKPPGKPATLGEACKKVNAAELKSILISVRSLYPDNALLWLRDAAAYFNVSLVNQQSFDLPDPFQDQPLTYLAKVRSFWGLTHSGGRAAWCPALHCHCIPFQDIRRILTVLCQDCSESARQAGFETLLANLVHDAAKGQFVAGYLIILQLLAEMYPALCIHNTERFAELRNSYQNRSPVGTALLWALGQGGKKDLGVGLKVWTEIMLPLISLKNYSRFVVDYIRDLIKLHKSKIVSGKVKLLYTSQYFKILDAIFVNAPAGLNKDFQAVLLDQYPAIKTVSVGDCSQDHELFAEFLRRLNVTCQEPEKYPEKYQDELLACLQSCLLKSKAAWTHWQQAYITFLPASADLLMHFVDNWDSVGKKLATSEARESFRAFQDHNTSVSPQKEGVTEAFNALETLLSRMGRQSSGGWFPWKSFVLLLIIGLATMINLDVQKHGTFKASKTGVFLKDVGLYDHVVTSYDYSSKSVQKSYTWTEKNVPIYYKKTQTFILPYWKIVTQAINDVWKYIQKTTLIIVDKLNEYIPGIKEKLYLVYGELVRVGSLAINWLAKTLVIYGNLLIDCALHAFKCVQTFLKQLFNGKITMKDLQFIAQGTYKSVASLFTFVIKWVSQQIQNLTAT
eukprot:maker-scaffold868_size86715-snap-gene-0.23 protein:Tk02337 transcript:maker-scaffold868_size86715-snap-gene-0.23-mRNA-1 annotation:"hypothetical protein L798_09076"